MIGPATRMRDFYDDAKRCGKVIGTKATDGSKRRGIDVEGVIGIDNDALRFRPLVKAGWGRSGISYGPFVRANGLAFAVWISNGHNTSQAEARTERIRSRLWRWVLGSETATPLRRLAAWSRSRQKAFFWRTLLEWIRSSSRLFRTFKIDENLALGWFSESAPSNPASSGNSLVMHALGAECGELWARTSGGMQTTVRGVQNVPMYFLVVLRSRGAAYYVSSISGVPRIPSWPAVRLIAIDSSLSDGNVFAGIHQSVLGQIGFRVDTRVQASGVDHLPAFERWFGSAHGADAFVGDGPLQFSHAETGQRWAVLEGSFARTVSGVRGEHERNIAVLLLDKPAGFLRMQIEAALAPQAVGLIWRFKDENNYWCLEIDASSARLLIAENGVVSELPTTKSHRLTPNNINCLAVSDDGQYIRMYLNGSLVYATEFSDSRLAEASGVGFRGRNTITRDFEAHPREILVPESLLLLPPWQEAGCEILIRDDFDGSAGELAVRRDVPSEQRSRWTRTIGLGEFHLTGQSSLKVRASLQKPNPGRTAYTVPWPNANFADLELNMTPPGTRRGEGEQSRGGLCFSQDERNYLTVSLWMNDSYGFSISSFLCVDGYEELYDAIWTNIGDRVHWGVPFDFRVVFDGNNYLAYVDGEPVLHRLLTDIYPDLERFKINRVGIVANWEWGNDTGTTFRNFVGRA